jgi:hypothetical protein
MGLNFDEFKDNFNDINDDDLKSGLAIAKPIVLSFVLFIFVMLLLSSTYVIKTNQFAVIKQFGKIMEIKSEPGLYLKVPVIQNVQKVDKMKRLYDVAKSDVITKDKKSLISDSYVVYRVKDAKKYLKTLNGIDERARERIEASTYNGMKQIISSMTQDEVIKSRGNSLTTVLTESVEEDMEEYGIEIVQVKIKALDLPEDNKNSVYERMISERNNISAYYTAQGNANAQKIINETDKEVTQKLSDAQKQADILIAEGESEYMRILKDAYNSEDKANFYNYVRGLDSLKKSLSGSKDKTLILDKNSELVKILYGN